MYEPIHGSAPTLVGTGSANPIGTILSGAMLLRLSLGEEAAATAIDQAVEAAIRDGYRTPDLMPSVPSASGIPLRPAGGRELTDRIIDGLHSAVGVPAVPVGGGAA
jgi:isocitrate/isopropylmalate dehydrogenase